MKLETLIEVTRIKMEIKEVEEVYRNMMPNRIYSSSDAINFAKALIGDEDREIFLVLCLNTKNEITAVHRCHTGSINASIVHPREVFKSAILNNSASIIVAHNHPSGDCQHSPEDIAVTKRLEEAGAIIGIELLDSLIVSHKDGVSLREKGIF